MENSRKVTHGCIIATLKLYLPDGKEAKASPTIVSSVSSTSLPTQDLYQLHHYIQVRLFSNNNNNYYNDFETCTLPHVFVDLFSSFSSPKTSCQTTFRNVIKACLNKPLNPRVSTVERGLGPLKIKKRTINPHKISLMVQGGNPSIKV